MLLWARLACVSKFAARHIKKSNEIVCNEFEFDGKTAHFHASIR